VTAELARAGGVLGAAGLAVLFVARPRLQRLAGLAAWALGIVLLVVYLAPHGHRPLFAAAALVGLGVAAAGAVVFRRWPFVLPLVALACVAARIHVTVGSTEANLLVPLYAVVAAAAMLFAWELAQGDPRARELGPLCWPLAAFVAWVGLSILWTGDLHQGAVELLFFYLPFGLLALVLARLPWRRLWAVGLLVEVAAMALVFSAVGFYQYATRDVFWNPKLLVSNAYAPFYRVNSVFWDPSIYGRFLVVAILACLVAVLFGRDRRVLLGGTAAIALIWAGLFFSYSQSSFAALAAGVVLAAIFAWGRRLGLMLAAAVAVVVVAGALAVPNVRHDLFGKGSGGKSTTSGRGKLVRNGLRIAVHHPVAGVGVGGFTHAYAKLTHLRQREPASAASHTTPVTVAAETGFPGLLLYGWLLAAALVFAFRRFARDLPGLVALALGLVVAAIAVHSLFYSAFFEDPTVWGAIGLAAALPRRRDEGADPSQLHRQVEPERQQDQRVDGAQSDRARERDAEPLPEHR
jgi:putative inorganic carbon (hco3(-)) transporter